MFLLKMLGITQVFVVVNKMDAMAYKKERFDAVKVDISELLNSFDYQTGVFIPISAMEGDNIYSKSDAMDWYEGPSLIETLDGVRISSEEKPLRFAVQDAYRVNSERILVGRVESGTLRKGDEMTFAPSGVTGKIDRIRVFEGELEEANAGDSIGMVP